MSSNYDLLIPSAPPPSDRWTWATVTSASPFRIRLDGDAEALPSTPDTLFQGAAVGQRVWVQLTSHRVIVHAPAGGASAVPVGTVQMFASAVPPDGWLICNGGTFSSVAYPELATAVGDRFGVHSGTSYYLPDLRNKFPRGANDGTVVGATGGSATITVSNLPAHGHDMSHDHWAWTNGGGAHQHTNQSVEWRSNGATSGSAIVQSDFNNGTGATGGSSNPNVTISSNGSSHDHSVTVDYDNRGTTGNTGSGADYYQPYTNLLYIVKAVL